MEEPTDARILFMDDGRKMVKHSINEFMNLMCI